MNEFWAEAAQLDHSRTPFVVVTLLSGRGHIPQEPGAKAIITSRGLHAGTIGGGKIEARAIKEAINLLEKRARLPQLVTWNLQRDIGMTCGGEASLLFEVHDRGQWRIVVYGAGHVSQAVVRALLPLECKIDCLDPREEWIAKLPRDPRLTARLELDLAGTIGDYDDQTFFVVMTKGHATDLPLLAEIFRRHPGAPYVGVMGSPIKAARMRRELKDLGISEKSIARLHSPIGYPIGGNTPAEIAVSVTAELLHERDQWQTRLRVAPTSQDDADPGDRQPQQAHL